MKLWIDTEFNGFNGSLISVALVDENGHAFYEVTYLNERVDPWVRDKVIPVLNKDAIPLRLLKSRLAAFLLSYDRIHVIADWPEDIRHFCNLLITVPGTRLDTPPLTMEIRRDLVGAVSKVPHNALEDALAIKEAHRALEEAKTKATLTPPRSHPNAMEGFEFYLTPADPAFAKYFARLHRLAGLVQASFSLTYNEHNHDWELAVRSAVAEENLMTDETLLCLAVQEGITHFEELLTQRNLPFER